jgi:hypothetical protein
VRSDGKRPLTPRVLTLCLSLVVCLIVLEIATRFIGSQDEDGQFAIGVTTLKPLTPPSRRLARQLAEYEALDRSSIIHHSRLGWTIEKNSRSKDARYVSNAIDESLAYHLESELAAQPFDVEVMHFRLLSLFKSFVESTRQKRLNTDFSDLNSLEMRLCRAIVDKFSAEASLQSKTIILHLPTQGDLQAKRDGAGFIYQDLLDALETTHRVVDPTRALIEEAERTSLDALFVGHYSSKANRIVARELSKHVWQQPQ